MAKVASEIGETVPDVTVSVATGEAAEELVKASRDADMLVVGSRGDGGFARLLMGSVSGPVTPFWPAPSWSSPGLARPDYQGLIVWRYVKHWIDAGILTIHLPFKNVSTRWPHGLMGCSRFASPNPCP